MQTLKWTGSKGNVIELRARCKFALENEIVNADGYKIETGNKTHKVDAMLELWVDGKLIDSCWDIDFWRIIDLPNGIKKISGLKVGMSPEQAEIVERFLQGVIEAGKSDEYKAYEAAKAQAVTVRPAVSGDTLEETAARAATAERITLAKQDERNRRHPGYCTKCHSYCYGDCEAND